MNEDRIDELTKVAVRLQREAHEKGVAALITRYEEISDSAALSRAIRWAEYTYGCAKMNYEGADTLNKLEKPLGQILSLLSTSLPDVGVINSTRLITELAASSTEFGPEVEPFFYDGPVMMLTPAWHDRCGTIAAQIEQWLRIAEEIRLVAQRAHHQRGRGTPGTTSELSAAVSVLADYWTRTLGQDFKPGKWEKPAGDEGVVPTRSRAAGFLFDAMKLIDPARRRLGEELRYVMQQMKPRYGKVKSPDIDELT